MNHFVLTRSAYGPEWTPEANARRLALTNAVTIPLMAQQSTRDWTWLVLLDPRDALLEERLWAYRNVQQTGIAVIPLLWWPEDVAPAPWDRNAARTTRVQQVAATGYMAPWREEIPTESRALMTRIDDDDGFALDALERFQRAAADVPDDARRILVLPQGFRVSNGRYVRVVHPANAMHSLVTPAGDELCIYDYGHTQIARGGYVDLRRREVFDSGRIAPSEDAPAPVTFVDDAAGWLWVRHGDTISRDVPAPMPISRGLREMFPIDWSVLA
jgi:hypothetical protein